MVALSGQPLTTHSDDGCCKQACGKHKKESNTTNNCSTYLSCPCCAFTNPVAAISVKHSSTSKKEYCHYVQSRFISAIVLSSWHPLEMS